MTVRLCAAVGLISVLVACGGGGGGGGGGIPADPPTLLAITFSGAGPGVAPGDALLLTLSEAVELSGAALDDADLALSAGTLGAVTQAAELVDARTVRVFVGAGVSVEPGVTTFAIGVGNDAIRGRTGVLAQGGAPRTLRTGDAEPPRLLGLNLNGIEDDLNGNGAAGGTLQVPRNGFSIDVPWSDPTSGIEPDEVAVFLDRDAVAGSAIVRAGTDLAPNLTRTASATGGSYEVPAAVLMPAGDSTLTVLAIDRSGLPAAPRTFRFRAVDADAGIRPFERRQVWYLSLERDVEQFTFSTTGPTASIDIVSTPNGRPDALDVFAILGLWSASPLANVVNGADSNGVVLDRFQERMTIELGKLFDGVAIDFTFASPGTFPAGRTSVPYAEAAFSQLCIGGAPAATPTGTLGAALYDPNNQTQNDDCVLDLNGARLGVFVHTFANFGVRSGATTIFRQSFDRFTPGFGGTPIGEAPGDRERLQGGLVDARSNAIGIAILRLARAVAVVVAHECGHSLGLVANGPMPQGLYGGDPVHFPTASPSSSLHIENHRMFPNGSQNVMSAAIDFDASLSDLTRFNSLNLAYLRERALYDKQ